MKTSSFLDHSSYPQFTHHYKTPGEMAAERWEALYPQNAGQGTSSSASVTPVTSATTTSTGGHKRQSLQSPPEIHSTRPSGATGAATNIPTTRVELSISCRGLRDLDIATRSDPQCFVHLKDSYQNKYFEVGRTEQIRDTLNPDFVKKLVLNFNFEVVQKLRFELWDIDPVGKEFLGSMETTLADIVAFKGRQYVKPLIGKNRNLNCGQIIIVVEELLCNKQIITFSLNGYDVRKSFWTKRDVFLNIWKSNEDGTVSVVHKTEVIRNTTKPSFKPVTMRIGTLCNGDLDRSIRFDLMEWKYSGDHHLLGSAYTSVNTLTKGSPEDNKYQVTL